jgi:hypothetical protein
LSNGAKGLAMGEVEGGRMNFSSYLKLLITQIDDLNQQFTHTSFNFRKREELKYGYGEKEERKL